MAWAMLEEYRAAKGFLLSSIERLRRELVKVKSRHTVKIPENERKPAVIHENVNIADCGFGAVLKALNDRKVVEGKSNRCKNFNTGQLIILFGH